MPTVTGIATLGFGATPADVATVTVPHTGVAGASEIEAYFMREATADNGVDEHEEAAALCPLVCGNIVAGVSFNVTAHPLATLGTGDFSLRWVSKDP